MLEILIFHKAKAIQENPEGVGETNSNYNGLQLPMKMERVNTTFRSRILTCILNTTHHLQDLSVQNSTLQDVT